ncbi:MAG: LysR family transcriptional regulator [Rhodocyclaceae bacterium]|nr:LysR family transcriptional regulator [Rhodocyclaceae bacterium]
MELVALRTFKAVVEEGGVLAASRRLNTVQSNVTTRIRRLEEELGTILFFRKGRGLELAPPGRVLLEFAERMLQLERQTAAAVRQVGAETGELRIGSMETFAALHLPRGLMRLRERHPGVDLHIVTDTSEALVEGVLAHRLDCAFVAGPLDDPRLAGETVAEEELVCASAGGPIGLPLILFRTGCAYRARALEWQRQLGQPSGHVMEMGTLEGILGCVGAGVGWTLLPRRVIEQSRHADQVELSRVPSELARVPTLMVRHRDSPALRAADTLAAAVRAAAD